MLFWILAGFLVAVIYYANDYFLNYWSRRGIPQENPRFFIGNMGDVLLAKTSFGGFFTNLYNTFKHHRVLGVYFLYRPSITIHDPKLIQDVMIKDANSFHDRGLLINEKIDPLSGNLFMLSGQKWRDLRVKLSPTFTSGKLKTMFPIILDCAKTLDDFMRKNTKVSSFKFDSRDLFARFTTNVISSVAFGIENDCINDPDNILLKIGKKSVEINGRTQILYTLAFFLPELAKKLKIKVMPQDVDDFFFSTVKQTIDYREGNKDFKRKDFMQLMIELKNQGYTSVDKNDKEEDEEESINFQNDKNQSENKKISFIEVAAQVFIFFLAGFETSSSAMNYCLFELCKNPDKQRKVQLEIDDVMKLKKIDEITYENMKEFKYLDCCIDEALRKYPILPMFNRECTKDYTFVGTNYTIEKGTAVAIPVFGLHRDPDIYDDPLEFKPERFLNSPHGNGKGQGLFYMPFGDGPRNCIGARMGKLQTKLGLATILSKFNFELADKKLMREEIGFDEKQFLLVPAINIELVAIPR